MGTIITEEMREEWARRRKAAEQRQQLDGQSYSTDQTLSYAHFKRLGEQRFTHATTPRAQKQLIDGLYFKGKVHVNLGQKPWAKVQLRNVDASLADALQKSVHGRFPDGFTTRELYPERVEAGGKASTDATYYCVMMGFWKKTVWRRPPGTKRYSQVYEVTKLAIDVVHGSLSIPEFFAYVSYDDEHVLVAVSKKQIPLQSALGNAHKIRQMIPARDAEDFYAVEWAYGRD